MIGNGANSINEVMQRIAAIESRFGIHTVQAPAGFQSMLKTEMAKDSGSTRKTAEKGAAAGTAADSSAAATNAMILSAAQKYQVDPKLVSAIAETESSYHQSAVSDAGAVGVMQLMPDTAAALGVNPYDEAQNIDGGTRQIKQLLESFGGDVKKAVAAYNAGAQAVKDYNGVPPYRETQDYVDKVLDLYQ